MSDHEEREIPARDATEPPEDSRPSEEAAAQEEPRFGEAIGELEAILRRIEDEEIDIDELAEELEKAAVLLEVCRSKIRRAEVEVTQIVQKLEADTADDG